MRGSGREGVGVSRNMLSEGVPEGVPEGVRVRGHSYKVQEGGGAGGYRDSDVGGYRDSESFVTNTALGVSGMMGNQVFKSKP